jgi:tetratricopeptide (TPR) repeat protein
MIEVNAQLMDVRATDSLNDLIVSHPGSPEIANWHEALANHYYESGDSLQCVYHSKLAITHGLKANEWSAVGGGYRYRALLLEEKQILKPAIVLFDSALVAYSLAKDTLGLVSTYNNQALPYARLGNCPRAIESFQAAERLIDRTKEAKKWLAVMVNYTYGLIVCENYAPLIPLAEEALLFAREQGMPDNEIRLLDGLATAQTELGSYEEALHYFRTARELLHQIEDPYMESVIYGNEGLALMELERYQEAYDNFLHGLGIDTILGTTLSENYINLGLVTQYMDRFQESVAFFETGIKYVIQEQKYIYLPDVYAWAANSYHKLGQNDIAFALMQKSVDVRDSLHYESKQAQLQELNTRYETEKMQQQLVQSTLEIENQRYQKRILILSGAVLIGLLLALAALGWFQYRQRKLKAGKRQVELRYNLLRAQMNPHFFFNALHSIQGFFARKDFQMGNEYLATFSQLIRQVLDQTAQQTIYLSDEISALKLYLQLEQSRLKEALNYEICIAPNVDTDWIQVPPLILQPFVENAIWHGIAPKDKEGTIIVEIKLTPDETALLCTIEDDGVGWNMHQHQKDHKHLSKGIAITRERLGFNGQVDIISPATDHADYPGVLVKLVIPIEHED